MQVRECGTYCLRLEYDGRCSFAPSLGQQVTEGRRRSFRKPTCNTATIKYLTCGDLAFTVFPLPKYCGTSRHADEDGGRARPFQGLFELQYADAAYCRTS